MTRLTADLCAVAVVASAKSLGVDPIKAMEPKKGLARRPMVPAALALHAALTTPKPRLVHIFRLGEQALCRTDRLASAPARKAYLAALMAILAYLESPPPPPPPPRPESPPPKRPTPAERTRLASIPISSGPLAPDRAASTPRLALVEPPAHPPRRLPGRVVQGGLADAFVQTIERAPRRDRPIADDRHGKTAFEAEPGFRSSSPIGADDRALIDAALQAGRVQACPPAVAGGVRIDGVKLAPVPDNSGEGRSWRDRQRPGRPRAG